MSRRIERTFDFMNHPAWLLLAVPAIGLLMACCIDADGDGYLTCATGSDPIDCDDNDADVHPNAPELCNGIDDNCDGHVDENAGDLGIYGKALGGSWDLDRDGFPAWFWPGAFSDAPAGVVAQDYDSDDSDPALH